MRFQIGGLFARTPDEQARVNEDLLSDLNTVAQFVYTGTGVPSVTPTGTGIYFRQDPAVGAAVYLFNGSTWTAVV